VAASVEETLGEPMSGVILDPESRATPPERIREALRRHLENYQREARIIGVIEQMSRYDKQVSASRLERQGRYSRQVADSIRRLQEHGLADPGLDPTIAAAALGAMTGRFPRCGSCRARSTAAWIRPWTRWRGSSSMRWVSPISGPGPARTEGELRTALDGDPTRMMRARLPPMIFSTSSWEKLLGRWSM